MTSYYNSKGQSISLVKEIARSGEGVIWRTNLSGYLAKIYHLSDSARVKKLEVMVANPPEDPTSSQNHISIAWPKELLIDNSGSCLGFLMPEITQAKELLYVYNPRHRKKEAPKFNWYFLHITALNVASIIQALHAKNYIVGDMKSQNILVNDRGLVSVIDTDSFQVKDPKTGTVYRCSVGSEGFTPSELIGKDLSNLTQTRFHDRFRLAVIIHLLLFGYHPFQGEWKGSGDQPGQDESISKGFWPYGQNSPLQPSCNTIPLDVVHPEIKKCFLKCFNDGHTSPSSRPSAEDWFKALEVAISDLTSCSKVANHSYSRNYGKCYWCERSNILTVDIFPPVSNPIIPPPPPPHTYLNIYNKTSDKTIDTAYVYWDGKGWRSKGWWTIAPGKSQKLDIGSNYTGKVYIYGMCNQHKITWGAGTSSFWIDPINSFDISNSNKDSSGGTNLKKVPMFEYSVSPGKNDYSFDYSPSLTKIPSNKVRPMAQRSNLPVLVKVTAVASTIIAIALGVFCYYQYQQMEQIRKQFERIRIENKLPLPNRDKPFFSIYLQNLMNVIKGEKSFLYLDIEEVIEQLKKNESFFKEDINQLQSRVQELEDKNRSLRKDRDHLSSRVSELEKYTYINFCNETESKIIYAALAFWDGEGLRSKGWWVVEPGKCESVSVAQNYRGSLYVYGEYNQGSTYWHTTDTSSFCVDRNNTNTFDIPKSDKASCSSSNLKKVNMSNLSVSPGTNNWTLNDND